jgi:hypothetical protein
VVSFGWREGVPLPTRPVIWDFSQRESETYVDAPVQGTGRCVRKSSFGGARSAPRDEHRVVGVASEVDEGEIQPLQIGMEHLKLGVDPSPTTTSAAPRPL